MEPPSPSLPDFSGVTVYNLLLLDLLGTGTYGHVYRALEHATQKSYAVKCLFTAIPGTRTYAYQQREIFAHKLVSAHPNILSLHRIIYTTSYTFIVLDLISGGDLFHALENGDNFCRNDRKIKKVFLQIIDALDYCHRGDIYHRDLKPENILCSEDGEHIFLADFGLCTRNRMSDTFMCGSACYMSPDCFLDCDVHQQTYLTAENDIWALGVILVNMVSGCYPWSKAHPSDRWFAAFLRDPTHLQKSLAISDAADDILQRIFELDATKRISLASLREAVENLDTFFISEKRAAASQPQNDNRSYSFGSGFFVSIDDCVETGRLFSLEASFSGSDSCCSSSDEDLVMGYDRDSLPITPAARPTYCPRIYIPDIESLIVSVSLAEADHGHDANPSKTSYPGFINIDTVGVRHSFG